MTDSTLFVVTLSLFWFVGALQVYRGYVDDPRNTDNAWMETEAVNYHDETGKYLQACS